jgi:3-oxoacyl-[acyl-carrier protein] reductase
MSTRARTIIVTGAAGALGRAIARRLGSEQPVSLLLTDIDEDGLARTAAELEAIPAEVATAPADVSKQESVDELVRDAVERFGRLSAMINNAGLLSPNARIHNTTDEDWERAFRVNVMGAVHGIKAAVPVMKASGGGSIINTASIAGVTAWTHSAPYGATKAAVVHLTKIAALEYSGDGIRVNCVCPGSFRSAMQAGLPEAAMESISKRHPLGIGSADDLAGAYAYLAGDESRWTTGAALHVDGGYSLP